MLSLPLALACTDGQGSVEDAGRDAGWLPDSAIPDSWSYDYRRPDAGPPDLAPLGAWTAEIVSEQAGLHGSIALLGGQPRVAYHDYLDRKVMFASGAGTWTEEEVAEGRNPVLAFDGSGQPHIVFTRAYGGVFAVRYARKQGADWVVEEVDESSWYGAQADFALDSSGRAHVSYFDPGALSMHYARREASGWVYEVLDTYDSDLDDRVGEHSALAVDSAGMPTVVWAKSEEATDYKLKLARYDGSTWSFEMLDRGTFVWVYVDLDLDSSGRAHICYFDVVNGLLRYAQETTTGWQYATVASVGEWSTLCTITVRPDDTARVVFNESDSDTLRFAKPGGGGWTEEVVDRGRYSDLKFDSAGSPHLLYHDSDPDYLKFARRQ